MISTTIIFVCNGDGMKETKCILTIAQKKEELLRDKITEINDLIIKDKQVPNKVVMESFAEIFSRRFSLDFLNSLSTEEIYEFIKHRFEFLAKSAGQKNAISVSKFLPDITTKRKSSVVLQILAEDRPFIVDSLTEYLHEKKYQLGLMLYPVLEIKYSKETGVSFLGRVSEDTEHPFTYVCCIIDNFDPNEIATLTGEIESLMEMISYVTDDFLAMTKAIEEYTKKKQKDASEKLIESERRRLFSWINEGNVIILGSGEVAKEDVTPQLSWDKIDEPLGYVRGKKELNDTTLPGEIGRLGSYFLESGLKINLIETPERSEVHKKERIQLLFSRKKMDDGCVRVNFFQILFTDKSMKEQALSIPLARLKVNSILDAHFEKDNTGGLQGHSTKMAYDFFNTIPKSELFRLDRSEMEAMYRQFLYFGDYQKTKACSYLQSSRRYARITFCLPHHRFSPNIFEQIDQKLTERFGVESEIKYWFIIHRNAYSHHVYWFPKDHPQMEGIDMRELEQEVCVLTMGWEEQFQEKLMELDSEKASIYKERYSNAFGVFYQAVSTPNEALNDIEFLEALLNTNRDQVDLRHAKDKDESIIYIFSQQVYHLTQIMPHLQNLNLVVIDENTYKVNIKGKQVFIYTYYVKKLDKQEQQFENFHRNFCELFQAVLENRTEDDVLNGLLLSAGLNCQEINLFILYRNYYWQIGAPYLPINKTFLDNPSVMMTLRNYFVAKFDPSGKNMPLNDAELADWREKTYHEIYQVETVAEDIIFKTIFNLMEATLRTNYFNIDQFSTMAIKVKSADVERMPMPRPLYEIYVHGTHVEGIHLRGAMIARGGLRHSDRHDDFRTEVLGLMNTQMLKNVVIVPEGSKGGFITKRQLSDREERAADAIVQYKRYINSLLSLTDNIVDGTVKSPEGIVKYDGDDPYFVVAADKGTATFSDTANEISHNRNFWLGDAFASGGQFGYDHKGMGITARGGWESVKYHFLEEGIDIQTTDFTVIGIGDMSGDVFGNGMLLSKHIRLVAAFNHLHIFIDPEPDAAKTWIERERMFKLPRSNWMDFDKSLISQGGGIFERSAKSINLTPEIKKLLGTNADEVSGEDLIKLILQSKVDLLWNGGIGTYVKSSSETTHEVGDAANDAVRVDANQLRVKVIGEGGNLGLTQLARLEAAARGVKLNTDAIDNSGGVDTSDHEVNLKILMSSLISLGQIKSEDERNKLLEDLTDDIAELVLEDNQGQVQIISMDNSRSRKDIKPFLDLIRILTEYELLDPRAGKISTLEDLDDYFSKGIGIPRPDLSILLSFTKMYFYKEIIKSDVLDDPYLEDVYLSYFPEALKNKYDITKIKHPLKKEIIGTLLVNRTINQAGITLLPEIMSIVDTDAISIIIAYTILDRVFQLGDIRKQIMEELRTKNINQAYHLKIKLEQFIKDILIWMLFSFNSKELTFSMINTFISPVESFKKVIDLTVDPEEKQEIQNVCEKLMTMGISADLARNIAMLDLTKNSFEIIVQAQKTKVSLENAVILSKGIDNMFHFQVLHNRIMRLELDSVWVKEHRGLLMKKLQSLKQKAFTKIIKESKSGGDFDDKLYQFMKKNQQVFKQYQIRYNSIVKTETVELSGLAILLENISRLLD